MHIWSALLFKFEGGTCNACTMYASINTLLGALAKPRVDQAAVFFFQRDVSDCLSLPGSYNNNWFQHVWQGSYRYPGRWRWGAPECSDGETGSVGYWTFISGMSEA